MSEFRFINNHRIKTVILLKAVGPRDSAFLQSVDFNMKRRSYERAFALVDDILVKTELYFSKKVAESRRRWQRFLVREE